jgi:DNA-binding response OmpR family regulator
MSPSPTSHLALVARRLRAVVVTLDHGQDGSRTDSPASLLRALGHEVIVSGYGLTELEALEVPADVVVVEAGEHLEISRKAIQRLRQRPELMAARILLCLEVARVVALTAEIGADDFILFPTTLEELRTRLWQLQVRDRRPRRPLQLRYGEIVVDCEMRQAYRGGESLELTPYEFQLLRFLVERVNRVFTRQELLARVWGYRHAGGGRTVDTHALNLRKKLGDLGDRLQSVLRVGYKLQRVDVPLDPAAGAARGTPTLYLQSVARGDGSEYPRGPARIPVSASATAVVDGPGIRCDEGGRRAG